jgi:biopolymer transport protein ExbB
LEAAISVCAASISSLAIVVRAGLETKSKGAKATEEIMEATAMEERTKLEKNLNILGTLGNIAPLIGLLGTVLGIISAFHAMAISGTAGPSVISAGIAEALLTTAAGLIVAVPAVVFYNSYLRRVNNIMTDIEAASKKVTVMLFGEIALPKEHVTVVNLPLNETAVPVGRNGERRKDGDVTVI